MRQRLSTFTDLLFIFVASLTPLLWFSDNKVLTGHDSGFPLDPLMHFSDRLYLWTNRFGFGKDQSMEIGAFFIHGQEALLQFLGFTLQEEQKIIFIFWFFLIGLSGYILGRVLFSYDKYRFLALVSSFFLMFNSYTLQPWPLAERANFSVIIATALFLSVAYGYFGSRFSSVQAGILAAFVLFFFNAEGANGLPLYGGFFVAFLLALSFFSFTYWQKSSTTLFSVIFQKLAPFIAVFGVSLLFLDAFWFLPLWHYAHFNLSLRVGAQGNIEGLLAWLHMVNANSSLFNLFRLQGEAGWYGKTTHPFGPLYLTNPFLILASFFWPLLAFLALLWSKKEEKRQTVFLALLALAGIFFTAGSYPPTGILFEQMFRHIPGFLVFRSAWNKFNYIISIPYAVLIGFTVDKIYFFLKEKISKISWLPYFFLAVFFAVLVGYNFPYFSRKMFVWNKPLTLMVEIPQYIKNFGKWSESLPQDSRFLVLPAVNEQWSGTAFDWGYFSSTSPVSVLTSRATFANYSYLSSSQQEMVEVLNEDLLKQNYQEARLILDILKINYVLLEKDTLPNLSWIKSIPAQNYEKSLTNTSWLMPVKTFGKWEVYQIADKNPSSVFSVTNNFSVTNLSTGKLLKWMAQNQDSPNVIYITYRNSSNNYGQPPSYLWQTQCLNCQMEKMAYFLPEVRVLPGSRFYNFLVAKKEEKLLANENNLDQSQKIDLYLGLSLKRLAQIDRLTEVKNYREAEIVLSQYLQMLDKIDSLLPQNNQLDTDLIMTQKRLFNYAFFAQEKLKFFQNRGISDAKVNSLIKTADNNLGQMQKQILLHPFWAQNKWHKIYSFDIPAAGRYLVKYLNPAKTPAQLLIDKKPVDKDNSFALSLGKHELEILEAGDLAINDPEPVLVSQLNSQAKNLPAIKWQTGNQTQYWGTAGDISSDFFLEFKDSYNDNWQLFVDDKPITAQQHFEANGFSNGWLVKTTDWQKKETHTLALSFLPQQLFQVSSLISLVAFVVLSIALIISFVLNS